MTSNFYLSLVNNTKRSFYISESKILNSVFTDFTKV